MLKFLKDNKEVIAIILLLALFFTVIANLTTCNNPLRGLGKDGEKFIDSLNKVDIKLLEANKKLSDSIIVLHNAAINQNNKDTIYVNKIKYYKTKTNEEVNSIPTLSPDSVSSKFSTLAEEFISTRFSEDTL
jgi:predicted small secreted protein